MKSFPVAADLAPLKRMNPEEEFFGFILTWCGGTSHLYRRVLWNYHYQYRRDHLPGEKAKLSDFRCNNRFDKSTSSKVIDKSRAVPGANYCEKAKFSAKDLHILPLDPVHKVKGNVCHFFHYGTVQ